jgi:hypothetical protein
MGVDLEQSLYALDSTTIDLCLKLFPWARFRRHKAAVKMHTLLDLHGRMERGIATVRDAAAEGRQMIERSRQSLDHIHEEDREEVIDLNQTIESAIEGQNAAVLAQALHDMRELLFFIEGRA